MKSNLKNRIIALVLCMALVLSGSIRTLFVGDFQADEVSTEEAVTTPEPTTEAVQTSSATTSSNQSEVTTSSVPTPVATSSVVTTPVAEPQAVTPTPVLELTYEDEDLKVTANAQTAGIIPEGAALKVVPILINVLETQEQYKAVKEQLDRRAVNETYDIAGFLAYDICFVDAAGNKVEPYGDVWITMEHKKEAIPEGVTVNDQPAETVMHLMQDAPRTGEITQDLIADETDVNRKAGMEITAEAKVKKTVFVTNYFYGLTTEGTSYFTEVWMKAKPVATPEPTVEPTVEPTKEVTAEPTKEATKTPITLDYEDKEVTVEVTAEDKKVIPEGATLKVVPILSDKKATKEQYQEVKEQLEKKAEDEEYDIAGFLAYDISLVDKDGKEVEPNGEVKVSLDYKKNVVPEGVDTTEDANLDVTVMHLEEDIKGKVKEVVDMVADEKIEAAVETTENVEVKKAEFVTDSFSAYTITWKRTNKSTQVIVNFHYGYMDGSEYKEFTSNPNPTTETSREITDEEVVDLEDAKHKPEIQGYNFNSVKLNDVSTEITARYLKRSSGVLKYSTNNSSYTNWITLAAAGEEITGDVFYLYEKVADTRATAGCFTPNGIDLQNSIALSGYTTATNVDNIEHPATISKSSTTYNYKYVTVAGNASSPTVKRVMYSEEKLMYSTSDTDEVWEELKEGEAIRFIYSAANTIDTANTAGLIDISLYDYTTGSSYNGLAFNWGSGSPNYNSYVGNWGTKKGNTAVQGIMSNYLYNAKTGNITSASDNFEGIPGVIAANNQLASQLFANPVDTGLNRLFTFNKNNGYYEYDSAKNYAFYDISANNTEKNFKVYDSAARLNSSNGGDFAPLYDKLGTAEGDSSFSYGMRVGFNFSQPESGLVNGDNMKFEFSGDDDVWVYIDGKLVLDLGGIHGVVSGSIDFATGAVTVNNDVAKATSSSTTLGKSTTLKTIFENEKGYTFKENTFTDYSEHRLEFIYFERGANVSNCHLKFNMPPVPKGSVRITKQITNTDKQKYANAEFSFKAYIQDAVDSEHYTVIPEGTHFQIWENGVNTNESGVVEAGGVFKLKDGQTAVFTDIADSLKLKYYAEEIAVTSDEYSQVTIPNWEVSYVDEDGNKVDVTDADAGEGQEYIARSNEQPIASYSNIIFQNRCAAANRRELKITKTMAGNKTTTDTFSFKIQLTNTNNELSNYAEGDYYLMKGNDYYYYGADGSLKSNGTESIVCGQTTSEGIVSGVPVGYSVVVTQILSDTSFKVEEVGLDTALYATPVKTTSNCVASTVEGADGMISLGSDALVTIQNKMLTEQINFYINLNSQILDTTGNTANHSTTLFTKSVSGNLATLGDGIHKDYMLRLPSDHNHSSVTGDNVLSVLSGTSDSTAKSIDELIRKLDEGTVGNQTGQTNKTYQIIDKDGNGSFPTDEEVFAYVRDHWNADNDSGVNKKQSLKVNGVAIDKNKLTTDNFKLRWYVLKDTSGDYWHIDGVLVPISGTLNVTKTFPSQTIVDKMLAKTGNDKFKIEVTGKFIQDDKKDSTVTLGLEDDFATHVENADGSVTYTWPLSILGTQYKVEEKNYSLTGEYIYERTSYVYTKADGSTENGTTTSADITTVISSADEDSNTQTFAFTNYYIDVVNSIETSKDAQVVNWDDRTYNITLNASSTATSTVTEPVDVVLVLDKSPSMNFRSGLVYSTEGTSAKLDKSKVYYYVTNDSAATVYRVWFQNNSWRQMDDSSWNYSSGNNGLGSNLASGSRIYYTAKDNYDRLHYLNEAAKQFISDLNDMSPNSKVGLVTFGASASTDKNLISVGQMKNEFTGVTVASSGGTNQQAGLTAAKDMLSTQGDKDKKKFVILLTDGCPNASGVDYGSIGSVAKQVRDLENCTLMTVSVGLGFAGNENIAAAKTEMEGYASKAEDNKPYAYSADDADGLTGVFRSIIQSINGIPITQAVVKDYIDPRFEVVEQSVTDAGGTVGTDADGRQYVIWNDQTLNAKVNDRPGWSKTFQVVAKNDYIGGNNVTTNGAGSGVIVGETLIPFENPVVNVKAEFTVAPYEVTIYKGDSVPTNTTKDGTTSIQSAMTTSVQNYIGKYGVTAESFTYNWYSDEACATAVDITNIAPTAVENKYYLKVTYNAGDPTDASNENTTLNGEVYHAGMDDANENDNIVEASAAYTIKIINGAIEITKKLEHDAATEQTFNFKVQQKSGETYSDLKTVSITIPAGTKAGTEVGLSDTVKAELTGLTRGEYRVVEDASEGYTLLNASIGTSTNTENALSTNGKEAIFKLGYVKDQTGVDVISNDYKYNPTGRGVLGIATFTNAKLERWQIIKQSSSVDATTGTHPIIEGAEFTLTASTLKDASNQAIVYTGISGTGGVITWKLGNDVVDSVTFAADTYTLKETKAPAGYSLSKDSDNWTVVIAYAGAKPTITKGTTAVESTSTSENGIYTYVYENEPLYDLPSTGGIGIYWYSIGGVLLMLAAAMILYRKRLRGEVLKR